MKISYIRILLVFIFGLFMSTGLFAQDTIFIQRSNNKIVLEGKVYYVHVVKQGQTLWSISRAYNVTDKEVLIENPGTTKDLQIGQVLKIPASSTIVENVDTTPIDIDEKFHIIKEGETVYSVSRIYQCNVDDIMLLNPELDINDIPIGTKILLPPEEKEQHELAFDEEGIIYHKVKKGETLWSIARYYEVGKDEIKDLNPQLRWGIIRTDDVLKIPQPNTTLNLFTQDTTRLADEIPMDTLESDSLVDVYEYEELRLRDTRRDKAYNVAYLIPFNYQEPVPLDTLLKDVKSAARRKRMTEDYQQEQQIPRSVELLEFLEGSLLAVDSLTDSDVRFDLHVYDTKRSMAATREILNRPEMSNMDLIIGPFFSYNLELVSEFGKENHIPVVTPFHSDDSLIVDNPYLIQFMPSYEVECKRNAEFIARSYNKNLVFVHDGDSAKLEKIEFYKKELFKELEKYAALENVLFKEVIIKDGNRDAILQSLNPEIENLVILPAQDEAFASNVASTLNYEVGRYKIELFGSSYWVGFDNIEIEYMHALQLHVSHMLWFDHNNPLHENFLRNFRHNYFREPVSKYPNGSYFAISGYDLSLYFLSALHQYGRAFILFMNDLQVNGTINDIRFERLKPNSGWQNEAMHYYFFKPELDVEEVFLPSRPPVHHYLRPAGDDPVFFQWSSPIEEAKPDTTIINH